MSAPEFDPALVERAAQAICGDSPACESCVDVTLHILTVAAPDLRAEGARQALATLEEQVETWGLYSKSGYGQPYIDGVTNTLAAAREAVARIEREC